VAANMLQYLPWALNMLSVLHFCSLHSNWEVLNRSTTFLNQYFVIYSIILCDADFKTSNLEHSLFRELEDS
jgi:hypothetical protein